MNANERMKNRSTTRLVLDPPSFVPPPEMRRDYLELRKAELESMFDGAANSEWKPVNIIANHVRGTGEMYGFPNIGAAAENLARAIQNGDAACMDFLNKYATAVNESFV